MVDLSQIAAMLQTQLNANEYGIIFDIKPDRNTYIDAMRDVTDFHIPGVLSALPGNYEPLQGIKVYYMPVALELWAYAALGNECVPVPFTLEQQKACVSNVVEALNGTTVNIGNDAVIVAGAVVTVGDASPNSGGGYVRIPLLVTLQLTVVQSALMSNDVVITIDGERVYATDFTYSLTKQPEPYGTPAEPSLVTVNKTQQRVFRGNFYFLSGNNIIKTLYDESFTNNLNTAHTLVFNGNTVSVCLQDFSVLLAMGTVARAEISFLER